MTASMGAEHQPLGRAARWTAGAGTPSGWRSAARCWRWSIQDRTLRFTLCRPALAMQDAGGQVGEGLADAGPRVAQGDAAVQHGVQDAVTQPDRFPAASRHAPLRQ